MPEELDKLQGTWSIVSLEMEGREMPSAMLAGARIVVNGDRFTTIAMGETYDGIVELDGNQTPKTFNLKFTAGPEMGNTSLGIYELDGDTWKICLTVTGKDRPKEFATSRGSGLALETLRRQAGTDVQLPHDRQDPAR